MPQKRRIELSASSAPLTRRTETARTPQSLGSSGPGPSAWLVLGRAIFGKDRQSLWHSPGPDECFLSVDSRKPCVHRPQPIGHSFQQGIPKSGNLCHCGQLTRSDDEQFQIRQGGDGGAARAAVQSSHFPKKVAGAKRVDPSACLSDFDGAREDKEEFPVVPPLPDNDFALFNLDVLRQARHFSELGLGACPEIAPVTSGGRRRAAD